MVDNLSPQQRRRSMSRVRQRNTSPELLVRKLLSALGYRYRLHLKDLPGVPDIVLPGLRKAIFVHGCFWHGHQGCRKGTIPKTNADFWERKLSGNIRRDIEVQKQLSAMGWNVFTIWECQTRNPLVLEHELRQFLEAD